MQNLRQRGDSNLYVNKENSVTDLVVQAETTKEEAKKDISKDLKSEKQSYHGKKVSGGRILAAALSLLLQRLCTADWTVSRRLNL